MKLLGRPPKKAQKEVNKISSNLFVMPRFSHFIRKDNGERYELRHGGIDCYINENEELIIAMEVKENEWWDVIGVPKNEKNVA